jgi:hypothetical protein
VQILYCVENKGFGRLIVCLGTYWSGASNDFEQKKTRDILRFHAKHGVE